MSDAVITDLHDLKDKKRAWRLKRLDPVEILEFRLDGYQLVAEIEFQDDPIYGELAEDERELIEEVGISKIFNALSPNIISKARKKGYRFLLGRSPIGEAITTIYDPECRVTRQVSLDNHHKLFEDPWHP